MVKRVAIYDIYCTTDTGEKIIVEMQNRYQPNFKDRALYYLSRAIVEEECTNDFERWIYVLKNMPMLKRMPFEARKAVFKRLGELAEVGALSKEDMDRYQTSLDVHRDNLVVLEQAKLDGWNEGMEKGLTEGIKKGLEEGILQTAKKFKELGVSPEHIHRATGLSIEEINLL